MANFISNKFEYEYYKLKVGSILKEIPFEENPFHERFKYFLGFEFDYIFNESFFEGLKEFSKASGNESIVFYTIKPSPLDYFFRHFNKFNLFEISNTASDSELNEILTKDPGGSPADSLFTNSNEITWFSESEDWAILCSRDWELGIVGFTNHLIKNLFTQSYTNDGQSMFTTIEKQIIALEQIKSFNQQMIKRHRILLKNYINRSR